MVALALATIVPACNGDGGTAPGSPNGELSSGASADTAKPCDLVDHTDIGKIMGIPLRRGGDPAEQGVPASIGVVGMQFCRFSSADPGRAIIDVGIARAFPRESFDEFTTSPGTGPVTPLSEVGIEAVWLEDRDILVVLGQDDVVGVYLSVRDQHDVRAAAVEIAAFVLDQI